MTIIAAEAAIATVIPVTEETFDQVIVDLFSTREIVVDVETDGLQPWHGDRLCGIGIAVSDSVAYYLPYRHPEGNLPMSTLTDLWAALRVMPRIIGYNLKFDLAFLYQDGYDPPSEQELVDVLVASRMCSPGKYDDLSLSGQLEAVYGPEARQYDDEFKRYLRKNRWQKTYHKAPAEVVGAYCIQDVLSTWRLRARHTQFIFDTKQTRVWEQEQDQTRALWESEKVGMGYDPAYAQAKIPQLAARIDNLMKEMYALAGREFNLNSNPQLTSVMHALGIKSPAKSEKTGKDRWPVGVMLTLDHPIAGKILEIRGLQKVKGTYFDGIAAWPDSTVHGQLKNWGTITGRLSGANPNMQNIAKNVQNLEGNAIDDEAMAAMAAFMGARGDGTYQAPSTSQSGVTLGGNMAVASGFQELENQVSVRRLFVGREGFRLYMMDYTQMEIRVFADYVQDPHLNEMLEDAKFDFHSHVAKTVWKIDESSTLWDFYRTLAKAINFGMIYGIGVKKLAAQIQKTVEEAREYKEQYFNQFPNARDFIDAVGIVNERRGHVFNRFGRRYWVDANRPHVAVNYLIQGTSADIVKNRMNACRNFLMENNCRSRILTQVHDEILFEIHDYEDSWVPFEMKRVMEERQIDTLLPVDLARGCPSWANEEKWVASTQSWKREEK